MPKKASRNKATKKGKSKSKGRGKAELTTRTSAHGDREISPSAPKRGHYDKQAIKDHYLKTLLAQIEAGKRQIAPRPTPRPSPLSEVAVTGNAFSGTGTPSTTQSSSPAASATPNPTPSTTASSYASFSTRRIHRYPRTESITPASWSVRTCISTVLLAEMNAPTSEHTGASFTPLSSGVGTNTVQTETTTSYVRIPTSRPTSSAAFPAVPSTFYLPTTYTSLSAGWGMSNLRAGTSDMATNGNTTGGAFLAPAVTIHARTASLSPPAYPDTSRAQHVLTNRDNPAQTPYSTDPIARTHTSQKLAKFEVSDAEVPMTNYLAEHAPRPRTGEAIAIPTLLPMTATAAPSPTRAASSMALSTFDPMGNLVPTPLYHPATTQAPTQPSLASPAGPSLGASAQTSFHHSAATTDNSIANYPFGASVQKLGTMEDAELLALWNREGNGLGLDDPFDPTVFEPWTPLHPHQGAM
ncbi:hypothetical protein K461DRAFT_292812 [Myriangium duriaei CBS 260.36]|uniref:Uncharacterized protein n=1 Tax=Myriangium duriaei CBS 260.36 TaxID=1168546 RepID=A0A9P4J814_9PEZI|nr:hypothetical protein K461DRAFT_292812 [Myriangium duriaei CBS 260.36]